MALPAPVPVEPSGEFGRSGRITLRGGGLQDGHRFPDTAFPGEGGRGPDGIVVHDTHLCSKGEHRNVAPPGGRQNVARTPVKKLRPSTS